MPALAVEKTWGALEHRAFSRLVRLTHRTPQLAHPSNCEHNPQVVIYPAEMAETEDEVFDPFGEKARAADREERSKLEEFERDSELADLLFVMSDPAGRRFIHRMLVRHGVYTISYEKDDPYQTAFNEGRRNEGLGLLNRIMIVAKPQYLQMLEETKNAS